MEGGGGDTGRKGRSEVGETKQEIRERCREQKDEGGRVISREGDAEIDLEKREFNAKEGGGRDIERH